MLRFNKCNSLKSFARYHISIHPMLRFNAGLFGRFGCGGRISIHPMLRFNEIYQLCIFLYIVFQYILCYGSTSIQLFFLNRECDFNTSYVTVQQRIMVILVRISVNFNTSYVTVQQRLKSKI